MRHTKMLSVTSGLRFRHHTQPHVWTRDQTPWCLGV